MSDPGHNGGPKLDDGRKGWVAIHRSMREHWLVGFGQPVKPMDPERGALSRSEAWIDLIMECRYEDGYVMNGGRKMMIKPGELIGAVSYLAARWNWTPMTVRTFLDKLEGDGMISRSKPGVDAENNTQRGKQATVITVCNYSDYQVIGNSQIAPDNTQTTSNQHADNTQATRRQHASNNNIKVNKGTRGQGNKVAPQPPASGGDAILDAFETWWSIYPVSVRKVAKGECMSLFRQVITGKRRPDKKGPQKVLDYGLATADQLIAAAKAYAASNPDPEYVPAPATWLNGGRWLDAPTPSGTAAAAAPWWRNPARIEEMTGERWRTGITKFANGTWPIDKLGPAPGSPNCVVPREIIREMRLDEIYDQHGLKNNNAPVVDWMQEHGGKHES